MQPRAVQRIAKAVKGQNRTVRVSDDLDHAIAVAR